MAMRKILKNIAFRPWVLRLVPRWLKPRIASYLGCEFNLCLGDNYTEYFLWRKGQAPEHAAMVYLCEKLADKNAVIFDVGANAGIFGLPILRAAGPDAAYFGVEPNPVMQARLRDNINRNSFDKARVLDLAISDTTGTAEMFFPKGNNLGEGRISLPYGSTAGHATILTKTKTMVDCLRDENITGIDLLKVDVEGLEDRVIWPLLDGPKAHWPTRIYFEVAHGQSWQYPLLEKLAECGYMLEQDYGNNRLYLLK